MKHTIVGIGELLWDMLPSGKQMGGAPANFAYCAQELGRAESVVVSCVGDDVLGQEILSHLDALSLRGDYITVDREHPTGAVLIEVDEQRNHTFNIEENVAWDFIPETSPLEKLAQNADVVCFGSLAQRAPVSRSTVQAFLKRVSPSALCIFDINLRQSFYTREIIEASLGPANVLKANDDELPILSECLSISGDADAVLEALAERFDLGLAILTKGGNGSVLYSRKSGRASYHNGFTVDVADSVGAGDAFTAAVAIGMLREYDLDYINECANRVASFVCSQDGATPPLPAEIKSLFNA